MESKISPFNRFIRLLRPDKKEIAQIYTYAIFNGLVNLSLPLGIQAIINLLQAGRTSNSWLVLTFIVLAGLTFSGVFFIMQLRISEHVQQKIFSRASLELAFRFPRIKAEQLMYRYAPELMNRFFDTLTVQKSLSSILIDSSTAILHILFGLLLLSLYHPFFIAFGLVLAVFAFAVFRFTGKRGLRTSLQESRDKYEVAHWLEELARTNKSFKLAGNPEYPVQRTDRLTENYVNSRERHFKVLLLQYVLLILFKVLMAAGLLLMGGWLVLDQQLNIGQFVAAEVVIILIMNAVEKLTGSLETFYDLLTGLEKIGTLTDMDLEGEGGTSTPKEGPGMAVELKEYCYKYPAGRRNALENINLTIPAGARIRIKGRAGSGSSTLLHAMAGYFTNFSGSVLFDGIPLGEYKLGKLRAKVGDVLGDGELFAGTIRENICLGNEGVSELNLQDAIRICRLRSDLEDLQDGLDTVVTPEGAELSDSLVQKLLLARAISQKPSLLLLDNAFEKMPVDERDEIIAELIAPDKKWTVISTSEAPVFTEGCSSTVTLSNGRIKLIEEHKPC